MFPEQPHRSAVLFGEGRRPREGSSARSARQGERRLVPHLLIRIRFGHCRELLNDAIGQDTLPTWLAGDAAEGVRRIPTNAGYWIV